MFKSNKHQTKNITVPLKKTSTLTVGCHKQIENKHLPFPDLVYYKKSPVWQCL